MTLARKRSRLIVVDGERYRWKFAEDQRTFSWTGFVVLPAEGKGQLLHASWDWFQGAVITPGLVAEVIRHALARGWEAGQRGDGMGLRCDNGLLTGPREYDKSLGRWVSRFEPVRLANWHHRGEFAQGEAASASQPPR